MKFTKYLFFTFFLLFNNTNVQAALPGEIITVARDLTEPTDIAIDQNDNLYITDASSLVITKISESGEASQFAGAGSTVYLPSGDRGDGGQATNAYIGEVTDITSDSEGNIYFRSYFSDSRDTVLLNISGTVVQSNKPNESSLRKVNHDGIVSKVSELIDGGGKFVTSDNKGNLYYINEWDSFAGSPYVGPLFVYTLNKIDSQGVISEVAGGPHSLSVDREPYDGKLASSTELYKPESIAVDHLDNVYFVDSSLNTINRITNDYIYTIIETCSSEVTDCPAVKDLVVDELGYLYYLINDSSGRSTVYRVDGNGNAKAHIAGALDGEFIKSEINDGEKATSVQIQNASNIELDSIGNLYIVDSENKRIRRVEDAAYAKVNVNRLYSPANGEHLYTRSKLEYETLVSFGWQQEGLAFKAFNNPVMIDGVAAKPWLRLYNPNSGLHHVTLNQSESDSLIELGWKKEPAVGYLFETQVTDTLPLFRLYNPNDGNHHWTMSQAESDSLTQIGWHYEGIAGYVYAE